MLADKIETLMQAFRFYAITQLASDDPEKPTRYGRNWQGPYEGQLSILTYFVMSHWLSVRLSIHTNQPGNLA